eukprot:TRINITY_DN5360_c0_g1_i1.p1 TRINITY_DN5360_c0_g1~~TRINITY_DN5360_c0_g1_i1.p1  ORF type:complete len:590 (+),score=143.91 TRINITY_DN5360_c0_g1_i1:203-1972(+)
MSKFALRLSLVSLVCLLCASFCLADLATHRYQKGEVIPFFANKIGPYSNPQETYEYYLLKFCPPKKGKVIKDHKATLGEAFEGDMLEEAAYEIKFGENIQFQSLCSQTLNDQDIEKFKKSIAEYYYFEFLMDDLPVHGFVGPPVSETNPRFYIFRHLHFEIVYNNDRVIFANVTANIHDIQELNTSPTKVDFSYSVHWSHSDFPFDNRLDFQGHFFEAMEIHWLSIMNSFMLVVLLTGVVALIILRVLNRDYSRYSRDDDEEDPDDDQDDYGWKLVHGDIFRFPVQKSLFSSLLGCGAQFLLLAFVILTISLLGVFHPGDHGSMYTAVVVTYALTSVVAGAVSAGFYKKLGGERWAWNIVLTATVYAVPLFLVNTVINSITAVYHTTSHINFGVVLLLVGIWTFIGFPLTVAGGIAGRRIAGPFAAPCRTKNFPREIPAVTWYRTMPVQLLAAGSLPFTAIYIELYYVFISLWGHTTYHLYTILFIVFIILLTVTACVTIALTYCQLSMEDHRWWWRSFFSGGSTGLFVFAYSIFYYFYRSQMSGVMQATYYFGYMTVFCYFLFVMLGSVGFYASLTFTRHIYTQLKLD